MSAKVTIHTDGGSRGNPGPAAIGAVLELPSGKKTYSQYLGRATNNEAEYRAVIFALKKLKALAGTKQCVKYKVSVLLDSELIANQLQGKFKVKEPQFYPWFVEIWNLRQDFAAVSFRAVPREQNREADSLVNRELDQQRF